ncbi:Uncharacterized protein APZ42_008137, partial [Daphnia magna]
MSLISKWMTRLLLNNTKTWLLQKKSTMILMVSKWKQRISPIWNRTTMKLLMVLQYYLKRKIR